MEIKIASANSVIIYFSDIISKETSTIVKNAYKIITSKNNSALIEIIPSYNSILVTYDIFIFDFDGIKKYIKPMLENISTQEEKNEIIINIDVYYGLDVGLDLQRVCELSGLSIEEIIKKHSSKIYDVYAIGFLPGFAYLACVDEDISIPRLETPRKKTPKGSVAIANNQTAIYPQDSPGGWNIIGKTTFELFDKNLDNLSPLNINSKIKFNSITQDKFLSNGGIL